MVRRNFAGLILLSVALVAGCDSTKADVSKERLKSMAGGELKTVIPVSGTILVDGTPTAGINIYLHPEKGGPLIRQCRTDEKGAYCWATYVPCDGLEPGTYRLAFRLPTKQEKKPGSGGDLFKGKYTNPMKLKADYTFTVKPNEPMTKVDYELTTK
ncbi:hypothetical protein [Schlesneria paludicola]|uniref:hypothetical protein n=1 Tax=Schlesneria paludicola TaxID=360056 RepID=UPI000299E4CD|nr:hypothetical protein [Schlesneria paludicola]